MNSTHIWSLNIPTLPPSSCTQHLFPKTQTTGLLAIGQLCDHVYTATFSKKRLVVRNKDGLIIIVGNRNLSQGNGM